MNDALECWPSQALLAKETGLGTARSVRRHISEARGKGFITTWKRGPRSVVYAAVMPEGAVRQDERGMAAQIIRACWWKSKTPPEKGWTMGREYSFLDPEAKRHGWPLVVAALELVPEVFEVNGKPVTGKLVFSRKTRAQWNECLSAARARLLESPVTDDADEITAAEALGAL